MMLWLDQRSPQLCKSHNSVYCLNEDSEQIDFITHCLVDMSPFCMCSFTEIALSETKPAQLE